MTIVVDNWFGAFVLFVLGMPALALALFILASLRWVVKNFLRFAPAAKPYRRWKQRRQDRASAAS